MVVTIPSNEPTEAEVEAEREACMKNLETSRLVGGAFITALKNPGWFQNDGAQNQISEDAIAFVYNPTGSAVKTAYNNPTTSKRRDLEDGVEESESKRTRLNDGSMGTPPSSKTWLGNEIATLSRAVPATGTRPQTTGSKKSKSTGSAKSKSAKSKSTGSGKSKPTGSTKPKPKNKRK
ncbi:hypothetical protein OF83DRAFT_1089033 [Amylostereum chailletii]|nr:hypothetical protein OF83DRAFT_1089033 [Amylostereum chailletii]